MDPVHAITITPQNAAIRAVDRPGFCKRLFEKRLSTSKLFLGNFSALRDEATGHRRNAGIRAGGHLGGHLGFAKLFPGALASTQGALWNGKLAAESLGNACGVRKTDRLHFYNGL